MDVFRQFHDSLEDDKLTWGDVWRRALTQPGSSTYQRLLQDSNRSQKRTFLWLLITGLVTFTITWLFDPNARSVLVLTGTLSIFTGTLIYLLTTLVILVVSLVLYMGLVMITTYISTIVATRLGSPGDFSPLLYLVAAYTTPLTLLNTSLTLLRISLVSGILIFLIQIFLFPIYAFILNVIAVKTVHRNSSGKAFVAVLVPYVSLSILIIACVAVVYPLLGIENLNYF